MATAAVLQLDVLLSPIAGKLPAGQNLRANRSPDGPYDVVRAARKRAKDAEREQDKTNSPPTPAVFEDWRMVVSGSSGAIGTQSKDLELATYLLEGLVRVEGFPGLRDGLTLFKELVARYWGSVYPSRADDDVDPLSYFRGLNGENDKDGTLLRPIYAVPLTQGKTASYSRFDVEQAKALEEMPAEKHSAKIAAGQCTYKMIQQSAAETPVPFLRDVLDDIAACQKQFDGLCAVLEEKCGAAEAPASSKIRDALRKCLADAQELSKDRVMPTSAAASADANPGTAGSSAPVNHNGIGSRDEAFEAILSAARYFRTADPQSPLIYALENIVRWGRMPLPDMLAEMIPDEGSRRHVFELIGIRPPSGDAAG